MDALAAELLTYKGRAALASADGDEDGAAAGRHSGQADAEGGGGAAAAAPVHQGGIPFVRIDGSHSSHEVRVARAIDPSAAP